MPQPAVGESPLRFGPREGSGYLYEMNLRTGELLKHGVRVNLQGQPFEALCILVERAPDVVTRDEMVKRLWPDVFIEDPEASVNKAIQKIRAVLGDSTDNPLFVETLPRRGYRFIGRVEPASAPAPIPATGPHPAPDHKIRSIAVLPFYNQSGDPSQEYFVDGMTDLLTSKLAQVPAIRVTSFTSAIKYKHANKRLPEIAAELGVDAVVEGSVLRSQRFIRITAQLIDAQTDTHRWSRTYERTLDDVWALQSEVALNIAAEIQIYLSPTDEKRLVAPRPVKSEALEAYLRGRFFWNKRSELDLNRALDCFREAILEDPGYAQAHTGIADCYNMLAWNSMRPPKQVLPRARAAALDALAIDDQSAEAHSSLAFDLLFEDWDWRGAEHEFRRSIELNPNYGVVRPWLAFELSALGREVEAVAEARRAVQIDPVASPILVSAALVFYLARQYDRTIKLSEDILQMDPYGFYQSYYLLGMARERKELYAEAVEALENCVKLSNRNPHMLAACGFCLARAGRTSDALGVAEELKKIYAPVYMSPFNVAMVYAGLGEKDETIEWLERAYDDHSMWLIFVNAYPIFDFLRPDPRFQDLVRRMAFPS